MDWLVAGALCALAIAQTPDVSSIELSFDHSVSGVLMLRADSTPAHDVAIDGASVTIRMPARTTWRAEFQSDEWWMPPQTMVFPPAGQVEQRWSPVWRTGTVRGKVIPGEVDLMLPKTIVLTVESPPQPSSDPKIARGTAFSCPVGADGTWSCRIPAATLDLSLRAPEITPHYRWDVAVASDRLSQLGTFALKRGASVTAWLARDLLTLLGEPARARLVRPVSEDPSATTMRLRVPVAEATFSKRGMAQLTSVPPGTYVLEVTAKGFAPARIGPLEVHEGRETEFRKAIDLSRPIAVEMRIDPPRDGHGAPWEVRLERQSEFLSSRESSVVARTDRDGLVVLADQAPGLFHISVRDAKGNRIWSGSETVHETAQAPIDVKISLIPVRGVVRLAGEPLKATLHFGGRDGAVRVAMESDESGNFEGRLPRPGEWRVHVASSTPPVQTMKEIQVPAGDEDLVIDLPDTRLSGRAVGADGRPLTNAVLTVGAQRRSFSYRLPDDGTFMLVGLPAGMIEVMARDLRTGEKSKFVRLNLTEGEPVEGVELRTEPDRDVSGTVVSGGAVVAGARIMGYGREIGRQQASSTATGADGRFTIRISAEAKQALIVVSAPGRTLQSFQVPITEEPLLLDVMPAGGTVEVLLKNEMFAMTRNGIEVPVQPLFDWIVAHGVDPFRDQSRVRVPNLAPGEYEVCPATANPATRKCSRGSLVPGGSLTLEIP